MPPGKGSGSGSAVAPNQSVPRLDPAILADIERGKRAFLRTREVDPRLGLRVASVAEKRYLHFKSVGQSPYMKAAPNPYGTLRSPISGTNKCNIFLYDILKEAGTPAPLITRDPLLGREQSVPPLANQWADKTFKIDHWEVVVDQPRPGDVAARSGGDDSGHVGIVIAGNQTISQPSDSLTPEKRAFGFEPEDEGKIVFRRYVP